MANETDYLTTRVEQELNTLSKHVAVLIVEIHHNAIRIPRVEAMKALLMDVYFCLFDQIGQTCVFKNRKLS